MDRIDAVLYINLEHRMDRKEHLLAELRRVGWPEDKIHRVDAVRHANGALGCGLSHIRCMELVQAHPEWQHVLVLEDDFTFRSNSSDNIRWALHEIMTHHSTQDADMRLLSYNPNYFKKEVVQEAPFLCRVLYSQTTSSYIIAQHYVPTLLQNFRESTDDMVANGRRHENCIDIHWSLLQPKDRWYAIQPAIGYQYTNYSDIEGGVTAYDC